MPNYKKLPAESNHFNGQLYQRMLEDLHLAGLADRTIYGYLRAIKQLADFSHWFPTGSAKNTCGSGCCT